MKKNRPWLWAIAGLVIMAAGVWWFRPFAGEPVYHGKTVTEWLDRMALFDGPRHGEEENVGWKVPSPEQIQQDPSLQAVLAMGSKAAPSLEKILSESLTRRHSSSAMGDFLKWKWHLGFYDQAADQEYENARTARKMAAGLAFLALGTNHHAGALRLIQIGRSVDDWTPFLKAFVFASTGLPGQHGEMVDGIGAGLISPDISIRREALLAASVFRADLPTWRPILIKLAQKPDPTNRRMALSTLARLNPKDDVLISLCEKNLKDQTNPSPLRGMAAAILGLAGNEATNALPLLRDVLTEKPVTKGSRLQVEASLAIQRIEKAATVQGQK